MNGLQSALVAQTVTSSAVVQAVLVRRSCTDGVVTRPSCYADESYKDYKEYILQFEVPRTCCRVCAPALSLSSRPSGKYKTFLPTSVALALLFAEQCMGHQLVCVTQTWHCPPRPRSGRAMPTGQ